MLLLSLNLGVALGPVVDDDVAVVIVILFFFIVLNHYRDYCKDM